MGQSASRASTVHTVNLDPFICILFGIPPAEELYKYIMRKREGKREERVRIEALGFGKAE